MGYVQNSTLFNHCWFIRILVIVAKCPRKLSDRSSHSQVFLGKVVPKISSKFTGEHPCRNVMSISNFIEIRLWHGCSPVNLLHIFRTSFPKNTFGRLLASDQILCHYLMIFMPFIGLQTFKVKVGLSRLRKFFPN